jgi:PAS domain S-box-containing protein
MGNHDPSHEQLIAELEALRARLDELERRNRDLFENAPAMYALTRNRNGVPYIEACNDLFLQILGYSADEVVGRRLEDFYTRESRHEMLKRGGYLHALQGEFIEQERQLINKNGELVETLLRATPETDSSGEVIGTRAMYVDITERKRAEESLRCSEEKYRSLFEDSQDAIFISTPEGRLLDVNRAGVELFGYERKEELLEVDIAGQLYSKPASRAPVVRLLSEQGYVKDLELQLIKKDRSMLIVLETTTAVRDAAGNVTAFRGILRDITQQRELEHQLRQAHRMEVLGQLAGGVAHDFNNLLMVIAGFAEMGRLKCEPGDPRWNDFEEIRKAGQRAAALVRQLLSFSRQQVLRPTVLDLNAVVRNVEMLLRRTIGEDIELILALDPRLGRVKVDQGQIEQVLMNLAVNARDAMPKGGRLKLASQNVVSDGRNPSGHAGREPEAYVQLTVIDTGEGMDDETSSRVFEPFFTTKDTGTGLGLSSAYGIVEQSGGHIRVHSEPGEGATFEIRLPRVGEALEPNRRAAAPAARGGSETILLVEDEELVRHLVQKGLEQLGYRVLAVPRPEDAERIFERHHDDIDLLLTDLLLPGINGLELAERLLKSRPGLKVLAVSGYADRTAIHRDVLGSTVPFLEKPFTADELATKVRDILDSA